MSDKIRQDAYLKNMLASFKLPTDPRSPNYDTRPAEAQESEVQARVDALKGDWEVLMDLLDQNWDEITILRADAYDQRYETEGYLLEELRDMVESELNLR